VTKKPKSKPFDESSVISAIKSGNGVKRVIVLLNDGTVWAWGTNNNGELGDGTYISRNTPVQVVTSVGGPALAGITAIAEGGYHTLALKNDGTVWAWGNGSYGQLGNGKYSTSNVAVQVLGLTDVIAISGGDYHSLAMKKGGTVWGWGKTKPGIGVCINSATPKQLLTHGSYINLLCNWRTKK
jgi:alpha-tubulin suppressor-like RCC1 family protein